MAQLVLTRLPCCFCFIPVSSFIILSNSAFSSASFCLCSAIFSLNLRGFDAIADAPEVATAAAAPTVADMFDVGMGDVIAFTRHYTLHTRRAALGLDSLSSFVA